MSSSRRARRIGRIGHVRLAAGELPQQVGVDRPEGELARLPPPRARPPHYRAARRSSSPRNTGRAAARCARRPVLVARPRAPRSIGGAAVLPDDRVVDRLAGARSQTTVVSRWLVIPIAGDVLRRHPGARHRGRAVATVMVQMASDRARPSRARDRSAEIPAGRRRRPQPPIEQERSGRGRPLIDRKQMARQLEPPNCRSQRAARPTAAAHVASAPRPRRPKLQAELRPSPCTSSGSANSGASDNAPPPRQLGTENLAELLHC